MILVREAKMHACPVSIRPVNFIVYLLLCIHLCGDASYSKTRGITPLSSRSSLHSSPILAARPTSALRQQITAGLPSTPDERKCSN